MIWLYVLIGVLALAALYLAALCPNRGRQAGMRPFEDTYIAHRGLHDNDRGVPENSLPAFRRAVEAGLGVELDVQLTTDDCLVVFHDETLERMCGDPRKLHELSYGELQRLHLLDTEARIPLLRDVLDALGADTPVVVEIKSEGRWRDTTRLTEELMRSYPGVWCVESFHPLVLRWFRKHCPAALRGQLATNFFREENELSAPARFLLTNLLLDFLTRPDFIAYDRRYGRSPSFRLCRRLFRPVCAAWTVKSQAQLDEARGIFDMFIFDSFLPRDAGAAAYTEEDEL